MDGPDPSATGKKLRLNLKHGLDLLRLSEVCRCLSALSYGAERA